MKRKTLKALSVKQQEAVRLIAAGVPYRETADRIGAHLTQVNGWAQLPEFQIEVQWIKNHRRKEHASKLASARGDAIELLAGLVRAEGKNIPINARLKAAELILDRTGMPAGTNVELELADSSTEDGDPDSPHAVVEMLKHIPRALLEKALSQMQ